MSPTTSDLEIRAGNWPILREPKFPYVPGVPAGDVLELLARIQADACVSAEASRRRREILAAQQLQAKLERRLSRGLRLANKTGELGEISHDAGIVTGPGGTLLVAVLTRAVEPPGRGADLIGDVALALVRATGLAGPA
jgi:Beta-lactamase enzyme family